MKIPEDNMLWFVGVVFVNILQSFNCAPVNYRQETELVCYQAQPCQTPNVNVSNIRTKRNTEDEEDPFAEDRVVQDYPTFIIRNTKINVKPIRSGETEYRYFSVAELKKNRIDPIRNHPIYLRNPAALKVEIWCYNGVWADSICDLPRLAESYNTRLEPNSRNEIPNYICGEHTLNYDNPRDPDFGYSRLEQKYGLSDIKRHFLVLPYHVPRTGIARNIMSEQEQVTISRADPANANRVVHEYIFINNRLIAHPYFGKKQDSRLEVYCIDPQQGNSNCNMEWITSFNKLPSKVGRKIKPKICGEHPLQTEADYHSSMLINSFINMEKLTRHLGNVVHDSTFRRGTVEPIQTRSLVVDGQTFRVFDLHHHSFRGHRGAVLSVYCFLASHPNTICNPGAWIHYDKAVEYSIKVGVGNRRARRFLSGEEDIPNNDGVYDFSNVKSFKTQNLVLAYLQVRIRVHTCAFKAIDPTLPCNADYTNRLNLADHYKRHHIPQGRALTCPISSCPWSERPISNENTWAYHVTAHASGQLFVCDIDGVGFGTKKGLDRHKRLHTAAGRWECPFCGNAFTATYKKLHVSVHQKQSFIRDPYCKDNKGAPLYFETKQAYFNHCGTVGHITSVDPGVPGGSLRPVQIENMEDYSVDAEILYLNADEEPRFTSNADNPDSVINQHFHPRTKGIRLFGLEFFIQKNMNEFTDNGLYAWLCVKPACRQNPVCRNARYVGQSGRPFHERAREHFSGLERDNWETNGVDGRRARYFFKTCGRHLNFIPLASFTSTDDLDDSEAMFITDLRCRDKYTNGMNTLPGGKRGKEIAIAWKSKSDLSVAGRLSEIVADADERADFEEADTPLTQAQANTYVQNIDDFNALGLNYPLNVVDQELMHGVEDGDWDSD